MLAILCGQEAILHRETCDSVVRESRVKPAGLAQAVTQVSKDLQNQKWKNQDLERLQAYIFTDRLVDEFGSRLTETGAFKEWKQERENFDREASEYFKPRRLLSKGNLNPLSLLKAEFIHSGYFHLFGNLAFFIFLSIFVELRLGSAVFLLLYLVSGYLGLMGQIFMMTSYSIPLVGASANIAGIAGAFTVLFWKKRVKIFGTLFFAYNKVFALPVYFFNLKKILKPEIMQADVDVQFHGSGNFQTSNFVAQVQACRKALNVKVDGQNLEIAATNFQPHWYIKKFPSLHTMNIKTKGRLFDLLSGRSLRGTYIVGNTLFTLLEAAPRGQILAAESYVGGKRMVSQIFFQGLNSPEPFKVSVENTPPFDNRMPAALPRR